MKKLSIIILLLLTGCSGTIPSMHISEYPEWNYMDQQLFMQNVRICRAMDHCAAENLFNRY